MSSPQPGHPPHRDSRESGKNRNRRKSRNGGPKAGSGPQQAKSQPRGHDQKKKNPEPPKSKRQTSGRHNGERPPESPARRLLRFLTFGLAGKVPRRQSGHGTSGGSRAFVIPADFPPADPSAIESERLFVGNLSTAATEEDLHNIFNGIGRVLESEIVYGNRTYQSLGRGFVRMVTVEHARRAVAELHGQPFMGRALLIGPAEPQGTDPREAGDEPES